MGGGCLIAIRKNIPALRLTDWEVEAPYDNVWLKISTTNTQKFFINCIYINESTNFNRFKKYIDSLMDIMNRREPNAKFIIMGDFNLPSIKWFYDNEKCSPLIYEGRIASEFLHTLTCTNLAQLNHIKNTYNGTLDLILTNKSIIKCKRIDGIVKEDPYHPALSSSFDAKDIKSMRIKKRSKLDFYKANYQSINNDICSIDWHSLLGNLDVENAVNEYVATII